MKANSEQRLQSSGTQRVANIFIRCIALLIAILMPQLCRAQACWMGFKFGLSIANSDINGDPSNPASKWADASSIQSGLGCLNQLTDWDGVTLVGGHASPNQIRTVKVFSKRDANNLYLAFQVQDLTQAQAPPGERIIIQIDPDHSRGPGLGAGGGASLFDYRIELAHQWQNGAFTFQSFQKSSAPPDTVCPGQQAWLDTGSFPLTASLGSTTVAGAYVVELKIPLTAIGNPPTDIGIAFAVINDLGHAVMGAPDATGIAFPATLPLSNLMNPVILSNPADPAGCGDWLVPNNWGGGYFNNAPSDVTISRYPAWWSSGAIVGFQCQTMGYDYFPI